MPVELEFSIMDSSNARIQPLLDQFENETGIHVRLRLLAWDSAWGMFVRAGLYQDGPDVSEVGTTWTSDLIGMNALRSYEAAEVVGMGKAASFIPSAWKTAVRPSGGAGERVWAIPWVAGARLIFYRPALLEKAGIDPAEAFCSNASLEAAVRKLSEAGGSNIIPWTVPTGYTHTTLLNIASWVWAAGGDFISEDGKSAVFMRPQAAQGLSDYFSLGQYLVPEVQRLNGLEPDDTFLNQPGAAMTISGPWLFCRAKAQLGPRVEEIAVTPPPGGSFVGGSNLVIWKHTRYPEAAVRLVRFLMQRSAQIHYAENIGLLPVRLEALAAEPFSLDPYWKTAVRGLHSGHMLPTIRLGG